MRKYLPLFLGMVLSFLLVGCSQPDTSQESGNENSTEITVAAAASLTDVMEEISEVYQEKNPEVKIVFTFGSSGSLMNQIEEGAPVDVFLSAAPKQMNQLEKKNLIEKDTRKDLLENEMVLIVPKNADKEISNFEDIATKKVEKIALGNPESVPAGQYSEEILHYLKIQEQIEGKVVEGTDVRQVLSWVETGEVDCGMVYATDAMTSDLVKVVAKAPKGSHRPVVYPAALIQGSKNLEEGQEFLEFLSTKKAQEIFEKYGFQSF